MQAPVHRKSVLTELIYRQDHIKVDISDFAVERVPTWIIKLDLNLTFYKMIIKFHRKFAYFLSPIGAGD